jgi:hypothetical protein
VIKKKQSFGIKAMIWAGLLGEHIEVMQLVYDMAYLKEIKMGRKNSGKRRENEKINKMGRNDR